MRRIEKTAWILMVCGILGGFFAGYMTHQILTHEEHFALTLPSYQKILVTQVIDGDTITVEGGIRVRLIGIDAPERGERCYEEAKKHLEEMILYKEVYLEKDVTDKDKYGRYLRYVWLGGKLVNAEMVWSGYAVAKTYPPDTKYQHIIAQAEQDAINRRAGCLWSQAETPTETPTIIPTPTTLQTPTPQIQTPAATPEVISFLDAGKYVGQVKTVEGTIVRTYKCTKCRHKVIFLNFHDPYEGYFRAIIWEEDWNKFPFAPEIYYKGKKVRVTGKIELYKGAPEIVVREPSQIEVVEGEKV